MSFLTPRRPFLDRGFGGFGGFESMRNPFEMFRRGHHSRHSQYGYECDACTITYDGQHICECRSVMEIQIAQIQELEALGMMRGGCGCPNCPFDRYGYGGAGYAMCSGGNRSFGGLSNNIWGRGSFSPFGGPAGGLDGGLGGGLGSGLGSGYGSAFGSAFGSLFGGGLGGSRRGYGRRGLIGGLF